MWCIADFASDRVLDVVRVRHPTVWAESAPATRLLDMFTRTTHSTASAPMLAQRGRSDVVRPPLANLHLDVHLMNEALRARQILASELDGERIIPVMRRRLIPTHGDPDHGSALAGQCDRRAQDIASGDAPDPVQAALGGPSLRLDEGQTVQRCVNSRVTAEHLGNWHGRVDHTQVNRVQGAHRHERCSHPDTRRSDTPRRDARLSLVMKLVEAANRFSGRRPGAERSAA